MRQNWLEWVALAVSVLVILSIAGFLLVDGVRDDGVPPMPSIELHRGDAYETASGWIVPATVTNEGDEAAEAVSLLARASVGGTEEESEVVIDYLPAGTSVEVGFAFSAEPQGEVAVRTAGFRLP